MRTVSTHSAVKAFGFAAVLCALTMGMSSPEPGVTMMVAVWDDAGQITDINVNATANTGSVKGQQLSNGDFMFTDTGTLTSSGIKSTLEVIHPTFGTTIVESVFLPQTTLRLDVVFAADGSFEAVSPDFAPPPAPAEAGGAPPNDLCDDAFPLSTPSSATAGTTIGATMDAAPTCVTTVTAPGVWYKVMGTGNTMTATTCTQQVGYDTKLNVYCGGCDTLNCIAGNDDNCVNGSSTLLSTVSWCSQAGAEYLILVQGFNGATGSFVIGVADDGTPCTGAFECVPADPTGACCFADGSCLALSDADCVAGGGTYQGDATSCFGAPGNSTDYSATVNQAIPDNDLAGLSSTITVPDSVVVGDVDFDISVTHTWTGDLIVTLSHGGVTATVIDRPGEPLLGAFGCAEDNWDGIILDDEGTGGPIEDQCAPDLTSPPSYTPEMNLSAFDGMDSSGDWTVNITDNAAADTGFLDSWGLSISEAGAPVCPPAECFLVIGDEPGGSNFVGSSHVFGTLVSGISTSYPVSLTGIPEFVIPMPMRRVSSSGGLSGTAGTVVDLSNSPEFMQDGQFAIQLLMWNPVVFPGQPEQVSGGLNVEILANGKLKVTPYGAAVGGITVWHEIDWNGERQLVVRFPFAIAGL